MSHTSPSLHPVLNPVHLPVTPGAKALKFPWPNASQRLNLNSFLSEQTITDRSAYGNNATLKSGVYFLTNGSTDKGIGANCSAEGSGDYYYTARIRSSTIGTKWATIGGAAVSANLPSANVWTDVTFSTASSVTPSACFVGWDGVTTFSDCDWSEVKLWKVGVSDPVAYWPGCDSEAASLDGHFVADVSGNGYHGAHVGGSSGSGETDILQTAGMNWNKRMWFDGTDDYILSTAAMAGISYSSDFSLSFRILCVDTSVTQTVFANRITGTDCFMIHIQSGNIVVTHYTGSYQERMKIALTSNTWYNIVIKWDQVSLVLEANGVSGTSSLSTLPIQSVNDTFIIGRRSTASSSLYFNGIIANLKVYSGATLTTQVAGYSGSDLVTWADTVGSNNAPTYGSPEQHLIPQLASDPSLDATSQPIDNPRPNGKVINCNGTSNHATVSHDASLTITNKATWLIWGNFYTAPASGNESYFAKTNVTGSQRSWHLLHESAYQTTGQLALILSSNGSVIAVGEFSGLTDKMQLIAITFDGTQGTAIDRVKMYADGVDLGAATMLSLTWPASLYVNSEPIYIGARNNGGSVGNYSTRPLGGARLLDRILTAAEIAALYDAEKSQYGL